jgi:hypothetical protein
MITGMFSLEEVPEALALAHRDKNQGKLMVAVHGRTPAV